MNLWFGGERIKEEKFHRYGGGLRPTLAILNA